VLLACAFHCPPGEAACCAGLLGARRLTCYAGYRGTERRERYGGRGGSLVCLRVVDGVTQVVTSPRPPQVHPQCCIHHKALPQDLLLQPQRRGGQGAASCWSWYACCAWCTCCLFTCLFKHAVAPKELQAAQLYLVLPFRGSLLGLGLLLGSSRGKAALSRTASCGSRCPVQRQQAPATTAARQQHSEEGTGGGCAGMLPFLDCGRLHRARCKRTAY
jgi:hypothetical protein